jgi:hypothetical protein
MDEKFRQFVKGFAHMGYGAMMQIISEEWYKSAIKKGDPIEGVLVGIPLGLLNKDLRDQAEHELEIMTNAKGKQA